MTSNLSPLAKRDETDIANSELRDLDISIARYVLPRLKEFRKQTDRVPDSCLTMKEWTDILDKMIYAIDRVANGTEEDTPEYKTYVKAVWNNEQDIVYELERAHESLRPIQEGLDLFHKYYRNLWW